MNSTIITVLKKELKRFFGDRRILFTTVLLPGLMIFVMYTFMGDAMSEQFSVEDGYEAKINVINLSEQLKGVFGAAGIKVHPITQTKQAVEENKTQLRENKLDLLVVFPEQFDVEIASYETSSGNPAPKVEIYYNSTDMESQATYETVAAVLDSYEMSLANKFDINDGIAEDSGKYDVATNEETTGKLLSTMLPMLLLVFLFSGCVAVVPETIAGEKERGTIATMLITPAKREHLALGKIIALSVIALLSGLSSVIGTMASLPSLMQLEEFQASTYGMKEYICLALVILSTVLVIVTLISLISAFAKTTKEAQTYVSPLMIVVILVGITAMFGDGAQKENIYYLFPIFNSVQCMVGIFGFQMAVAQILLTVASNVVFTGIGVFALVKMFNSEKIMFNR